MMLADPQWRWLGLRAGAIALVFAFEIVWHAGYLVVDKRGARLYKLWTRVELRWEDVRCIGTLTVYGNRYSDRIPMLLISPLERPWEEMVFSFEMQRMRNYLRFGDAYNAPAPYGLREEQVQELEETVRTGARPSEELERLLAHRPVYPYHVLAITFTNKAAGEL